LQLAGPAWASAHTLSRPDTVQVRLTEWKVKLEPAAIGPGPVTFQVTNAGSIPHAFEIEGRGLEKRTLQVKPGNETTMALDLRAGRYEAYCPVGKGSHRMLGMMSHLVVGAAGQDRASSHRRAESEGYEAREAAEHGANGAAEYGAHGEHGASTADHEGEHE